MYNDNNLLDDLKKQFLFPKDDGDWEKQFIQFIEQDIAEDAIIFIDNLNVTEEEEPSLNILSNAKCSIVCTSRIEKFAHYEVVQINYFNDQKCIDLFYQYYKVEKNENKVKEIIKKAGNHTLVIEILAKIANEEKYSLDELFDELISKGFDLEGIASIENKEDTLVGHLCRTFNFDRLNELQKKVLYCIAILPVQWIPCDIKRWLKLSNNHNINYLIKHAWFDSSELGYYMHPVVKEVVKRKIIVKNDSILEFLQELSNDISYKENPDYGRSKLISSFVESIISYLIDEKNEIVTQALYNVSMLYGQFGEYDKALKYIEMCIEFEEEKHNSLDLLASAYNHRGYVNYYRQNDYDAEKDYLKSLHLRKKMKNNKNIAATSSNLAILYKAMSRSTTENVKKEHFLKMAQKYQINAIKLFEKIFKGQIHPNLASAYNNMAKIYQDLKLYDEAIYYYRKSENIRLKIIDKIYPVDLSITYKGLYECFYKLSMDVDRIINKIVYCKIASENLRKCISIRKVEIEKGNQKTEVNDLFSLQKDLELEIFELKNKITHFF